ncbi:MAG: ABC transporter ATP-binding protein [Ekhidna sp.]
MSLIEVKEVSNSLNEQLVLNKLSLAVEERDNLAIVGETGSGKSTLLKTIGGLLDVDQGAVLFNEKRILGPKDTLIAGHDEIIYLSQHFELPKFITVLEHLDYEYKMGEEEAYQIFKACQIEHLLDKNTRQLSGGEKQRVALVKELLKSPKVLLIDEPFSNLDFIHKQTIKETLEELKKMDDLTVIMVSHEPRDVLPWADKVVVMKDGGIIQSDTPQNVYGQPKNEYVAGLFGKYNLIEIENWPTDQIAGCAKIDGKMLVRPEQIVIEANDTSSISAAVEKVNYYGSNYEVIASFSSQKLVIEVPSADFKVGDKVSLRIKKH